MVDWEETGATKKTEVKMVDLPASRVKKSLLRWLPLGEKAAFYDIMDSIGTLLSDQHIGMWGRVTSTINGHFCPKDKKLLMEMAESISQFYRATAGGGKKRCGKKSAWPNIALVANSE